MSHQALFDQLEKEFCPPLDTSLLAALVFDLQLSFSESDTGHKTQIEGLRSTLRELADQAATDEAISSPIGADDTGDSEFTQEESTGHHSTTTDTSNTTPCSSSNSNTQPASFATPLGFLQAALPHVPIPTLKVALNEHGISPSGSASGSTSGDEGIGEDVDIDDLWDVVASILTKETIREMEERGLEGLDEDEAREIGLQEGEEEWSIVTGAPKRPKRVAGAKKKTTRSKRDPTTFTLGDIRHRQLGQKIQSFSTHRRGSSSTSSSSSSSPAPDPWTQISSLSSHLASLLPQYQPSFFSSYFHQPFYPTPYAALTACLTSLVQSQKDEEKLDTDSAEYADMLFTLLDILPSALEDGLDKSSMSKLEHNTLISDTELALAATKGDADASLDLVRLLRELDEDGGGEGAMVGRMQRGVYHFSDAARPKSTSPPGSQPTSPRLSHASVARKPILPTEPPPIPAPPPSMGGLVVNGGSPGKKNKPSPYQWQKVPERTRAPGPHPLAPFIPAYSRDVNGRLTSKGYLAKSKASSTTGSIFEDYSTGQAYGTSGDREMRRKVAESLKRRRELLSQATRMWTRGKKGNRGGEVAIYFAERAREFQELARVESLNASRALVEGRRRMAESQGSGFGGGGGKGRETVDLHGVTAAEAVVIVKEILTEGSGIGGSMSNPLKIITGKGTHSVNQISVLKPAVKKALVEDGWNVSGWEGGLVVRGKR